VDGWGKVKSIARHMDISERTCRKFLKRGMRHVRLPSGHILIKYSWADQYLEKLEDQTNNVDQIVNQIVSQMAD
jgi:hypothetical protein